MYKKAESSSVETYMGTRFVDHRLSRALFVTSHTKEIIHYFLLVLLQSCRFLYIYLNLTFDLPKIQ